MELLGQQQQVIGEHWDVSSRSLIKACAQTKKENATIQRELETQTEQCTKLRKDIESMKTELSVMGKLKERIEEVDTANEELRRACASAQSQKEKWASLHAASNIALTKLQVFQDITADCRRCNRVALQKMGRDDSS